jgi:hypothetical protein
MLTAQISGEKQTLIERLRESERDFIAAAAVVPQECERVNPAEGCWSVLEVVEHLTLSDRGMWKRYQNAGPNNGPIKFEADKFIQEVGLDRSSKRQAPDHVLPTGRFASLAEGLNEYRKTRGELIAFIESNNDFRKKFVQHPVAEMDGHQLFLLIAAHSDRHVMQIEEIKKSPAYQTALKQKAAS